MGTDLKGKNLGLGITQRKDGRYVARACIDGKIVNVYDTDLEAVKIKFEQEKAKLVKKIKLGDDNPTLNKLFEEWFDTYKVPALKESSVYPLKNRFKRTFQSSIGWMKIGDITREVVQKQVNLMVSEASVSYDGISEGLGLLRDCLEHAKYEGMIEKNPCFEIILKKQQEDNEPARYLNKDEIEEILSKAENSFYYELIYVMINSGLRVGEIGALQWEDIDFENGYIYVRRNLTTQYHNGKKAQKLTDPKTANSKRQIPFFKGVKEALLSQKDKQAAARERFGDSRWRCPDYLGNPVFTSSLGSPVTRYIVAKELNGIVSDINLEREIKSKIEKATPVRFEHVNPHALRHTFCSVCFLQGLDAAYTSKIMGHGNLTTTLNIYRHFMDDFSKEVEKFNDNDLPDYQKKTEW